MFALAGRVVNTGLVEVPMGITLREIVYDIGGGILEGRPFKAVQTGGPSGGCIRPVPGYAGRLRSLKEVGSIMGSGGMIVMDDTACMVDVARYFMDFCREESCGKCIPCRVGTTQLHTLLTSICEATPAWTTWSSWAISGHGQTHQLAASARAPPTRCSRPCATSARSTWPMSRTGPARQMPGRQPGGGARLSVYTLRVDGTDVAGAAGQSILDVAAENIEIPTLCHLDGLSDVGACRLCVVEVGASGKLLPACVTAVEEAWR